MTIETKEKWLKWIRENSAQGVRSVDAFLEKRFKEGGSNAVRVISCPPNKASETWAQEIEDFCVSKAFSRVH
ncbi:hypothetical protein A3I18_01045 [Candidatus Campbellbacteria bacterium RIFCSPLOWO2_02_FULL_35_11]|uniref:Uncharacterized protein n=2 Tax=Candidatus Campbelliibacteriota TaxID=1752727 RepID=A0A1F5EL08_9BACT|nr:MAG: hypothetical protein A3E89_02290 [Candidatus Campbellbacteria bacterium RIFCSPHIGHO2_12_FULL_35_10]OGD69691.1 MAG: hypothetical protein A3I18_01045 [Candidatus Campbellbacteria bacterium RIFCSPLOWO2_02_FULL_35_11]